MLIAVLWLAGGCASEPRPVVYGERLTLIVPGVLGDFGAYDALKSALAKEHGPTEVFQWGAPGPAFFKNFSDKDVHDEAEIQLASDLTLLPKQVKRIDLVTHSAGCGVVLGALARTNRHVNVVILLAPSVSPGYDLKPALGNAVAVHAFYSPRDTLFLKWRTSNFGTYDRIKTPAAGFGGFDTTRLTATARRKLQQHSYREEWKKLGNDGSHMGALNRRFASEILLPLLR